MPQLSVLHISFPSGVWGTALAEIEFGAFLTKKWAAGEHSFSDIHEEL